LNLKFSPEQVDVLTQDYYSGEFNYYVLWGPSGTGKSYVVNLAFYKMILTAPAKSKFMLCGNTSVTLYKNVISELLLIDAEEPYPHIKFTKSPDMITVLDNGAEIFCIGVNNEGSDKRIQGGSIYGAYLDEVPTYPESSFNMITSRLRGKRPGQFKSSIMPCLMTLNPDDEDNFVKTKILDRAEIIKAKIWYFDFKANPTLDDEYIESFKARYTGEFYERMVAGKWTGKADRLIFKHFDAATHVRPVIKPDYLFPCAGMDVGYKDNFGYLLGFYDYFKDTLNLVGEYCEGQKTTDYIARSIKQIENDVLGHNNVTRFCDTDLLFIADMTRIYGLETRPTKKDDLQAQVNYIEYLFSNNKIIIDPSLNNLIVQLRTGRWNKKYTEFERNDLGHNDLLAALLYLSRNMDKRNPYPLLADGVRPETHHIPGYDYTRREKKQSNNRMLQKLSKLTNYQKV
jgi:PBSX family phage terminase large subunit